MEGRRRGVREAQGAEGGGEVGSGRGVFVYGERMHTFFT